MDRLERKTLVSPRARASKRASAIEEAMPFEDEK
jgi:hypothetical protein